MKKIILTGANGMLAHDFKKYCGKDFQIHSYSRQNLDITDLDQIENIIKKITPDLILNCAAYTAVDDAEDVGQLTSYQVNTIGTYNLAKLTHKYNIDFITLSTDYVFDGENKNGYGESDFPNPINQYGMSKYLGEKLSLSENKNTIIIRTSWLYGGGNEFKNFVNTILKGADTKTEFKIVNDQFGIPTYTKDLSIAMSQIIESIQSYRGRILHLSNASKKAITWFDFANEVFTLTGKDINVIPCSSNDFKTKAKRPQFSLLLNNSNIKLRNWTDGLRDYLK